MLVNTALLVRNVVPRLALQPLIYERAERQAACCCGAGGDARVPYTRVRAHLHGGQPGSLAQALAPSGFSPVIQRISRL